MRPFSLKENRLRDAHLLIVNPVSAIRTDITTIVPRGQHQYLTLDGAPASPFFDYLALLNLSLGKIKHDQLFRIHILQTSAESIIAKSTYSGTTGQEKSFLSK